MMRDPDLLAGWANAACDPSGKMGRVVGKEGKRGKGGVDGEQRWTSAAPSE